MTQPARPYVPVRPPTNPTVPKYNQIAPKAQSKAKANFGGEGSSSDDDVAFAGGRSYCCGLWNTGDSICLNLCKTFIICFVCPLVLFWMWKSGNLEKLLDKAGNAAGKGCGCCKKFCSTVSAKLNGSCLDKLCNTSKCKHCCGIQRCCEGVCTCFRKGCKTGCLSKLCSYLKKCISCGFLKDFFGKCCACFKNICKCSSITKFIKSTCKCNWEKLDCCNARKGCANPLACCKECPCMSKCKNLDNCVCCEKSATSVKGCCGEIKGRCCNCCFAFKKSVSSKGQSLKNAMGRGRYKPKSKFKKY